MLKRHLINAALIIGSIFAYIYFSRALHPLMEETLYFLALCPVLLVGWCYGSAAGMLAGTLSYLLNLSIATGLKDPLFPISSFTVLGTVTLIFLGGVFGYLSELVSKISKQNLEIVSLAQIVNCSDDAIFSKSLDGQVLTWNNGATRIYGYTAAEMIGRQLDRLLPSDRQSEVLDLLKKIKAGERVENYETVRLTKDGRAINVSLTVSPITDQSGRVVGASTIGRDISKAKAAEEECHRLLVETEHANAELHKMDRVKDEFLSIMTHDLKSPLVAVLGYSDMMLGGMGGQLNEKQRAFIDTIKRQGQHLQSMIDGLLDYTRTEFGKLALKRENFNFNNLVLEAVKAFTPEADQKKIALDLSLPAEQINVSADQRMIDEIVTNLLSNALKYSPEGARVSVTLSRGEKEAVFRVSDTGKGIPPDKIGRVFDKFFMVEENAAREKRSLGLGLYIAKKFIEAHRGKISAESPGEGQGATFSFTLPL